MKLKRLILLILAVSLLAGCGQAGGAPSGLSSRALAQAVYPEFPFYPKKSADQAKYDAAVSQLRTGCDPALVRGNQTILDFAARSTPLALVGHEGENAIYSPLSLWSALAMAAQCANGTSQTQALDALGAADTEQLQELVRQIWTCLYTDDGRDTLTLANSIWLNDANQGSYVRETLDILAQKQFSSVYSVPMGTGEADQAITDWISQQTNGLIGSNGSVVETEEITLALLASTLCYRVAGRRHSARKIPTRTPSPAPAGRRGRRTSCTPPARGCFSFGRVIRPRTSPRAWGRWSLSSRTRESHRNFCWMTRIF